MDALDPKAYKAFQASNDLQDVIQRVLGGGGDSDDGQPSLKKGISVRASLMTPVKPMLVSGVCDSNYALEHCLQYTCIYMYIIDQKPQKPC